MTLNPAQQKLIDDIAAHGVAVVLIEPHDGRDEHIGYTVGLQRNAGWPELVIFGLEAPLMNMMLNGAVLQMQGDKLAPTPGLLLDKVVEGASLKLIEQPGIEADTLAMAGWFKQHRDYDYPLRWLQLAWPDEAGRFPDDPDCDPDTRVVQMPRAD